jgi:antitoxin (DNA-binding transcriptional repressor) of toxin-antitoxin stability system
MKPEEVTVTEAARNFADCINRTHYQGVTFVLLKNGKPVARIVPEPERRGTGEELAKALAKTKLSATEARAWRKDVKVARKNLRPPIDKWR